MQIRGLHRSMYRGARLASRLEASARSDDAQRCDARRALVDRWLQARRDGLTAEAAARAVGKPRATLYNWHKRLKPKSTRPHNLRKPAVDHGLVLAIERLRKTYPMWGKDKLAPLLWKQGFDCSVSKVGRSLTKLIARGVIQAVPQLRKGTRHGPRKHKRIHAKRLPKGKKPTTPGEIVQIDTVHINLVPGKTIKHFTAYCPVAKWTAAKAYNRATASSAALFLAKARADMPFGIRGIQIDGGSEFMAEFEEACRDQNIPLFLLPPRTPQLNGGVERCNGAWRYEFYACTELPDNVTDLNRLIDDWQEIYNFVRPHGALSGLTPAEYMVRRPALTIPESSQMS
jgi:putative transposase